MSVKFICHSQSQFFHLRSLHLYRDSGMRFTHWWVREKEKTVFFYPNPVATAFKSWEHRKKKMLCRHGAPIKDHYLSCWRCLSDCSLARELGATDFTYVPAPETQVSLESMCPLANELGATNFDRSQSGPQATTGPLEKPKTKEGHMCSLAKKFGASALLPKPDGR